MIVSSIFSFLSNSILTSLANAAATAVNDMLGVFMDFLNNSTAISLNDVSFIQEFDAIFGIAIIITMILAMMELAAGALQRNGVRVLKVPLNILLVVLGTTVSVAIVQVLLNVTDQLCTGLMSAVGFSSQGVLGLGATFTALAASDPLVAILLGIAMVFAVVAIVGTMIVRKVLVVVAVVFAPLALAGATAQVTRRWVDRWIEMTLALIFSKLILVIIVITGFRLMEGMTSTTVVKGVTTAPNILSAITSVIGGVIILVAATFSPVAAMKAISFTGGHFAEAAATGHAAASSVVKPAKMAATALGGPASAAGGAAVGGAAAAGVGAAAGAAGTSRYVSAAHRVLAKTGVQRPEENAGLQEQRAAATGRPSAPVSTSTGTNAVPPPSTATPEREHESVMSTVASDPGATSPSASLATEHASSTAPSEGVTPATVGAPLTAPPSSPSATRVPDARPNPSSAPSPRPTAPEPGRARPSSPGEAPFLAPPTPVTSPSPRGRRPSPPGTPSALPDQPRTDAP